MPTNKTTDGPGEYHNVEYRIRAESRFNTDVRVFYEEPLARKEAHKLANETGERVWFTMQHARGVYLEIITPALTTNGGKGNKINELPQM